MALPKYVCRRDNTDLSELVRRKLEELGHHAASINPVVEGLPDAPDEFSGRESFLTTQALDAYDDLIRVVVTCPTDDVVNVFPVEEA
jgi:hypothetical protein